jgi:hypothetical protein
MVAQGALSKWLYASLSLVAFAYAQKDFPYYLLPLATLDENVLIPLFQWVHPLLLGAWFRIRSSAGILAFLGTVFSILMLLKYLAIAFPPTVRLLLASLAQPILRLPLAGPLRRIFARVGRRVPQLKTVAFQLKRLTKRIPKVSKDVFSEERIRAYVKENPGAPFILGFQTLLIACVALLVNGAEAMANELAVYAYYMLVIGVLLQLASYIREERRRAKG